MEIRLSSTCSSVPFSSSQIEASEACGGGGGVKVAGCVQRREEIVAKRDADGSWHQKQKISRNLRGKASVFFVVVCFGRPPASPLSIRMPAGASVHLSLQRRARLLRFP